MNSQINCIGSGIGYLLQKSDIMLTIPQEKPCKGWGVPSEKQSDGRQENNRIQFATGKRSENVIHQILQTGPPSLSVPPGLPEPDDVSMVWLCQRSYEAMTEVRPRLDRGQSYDQPTKTYPARQGGMFEISKKKAYV